MDDFTALLERKMLKLRKLLKYNILRNFNILLVLLTKIVLLLLLFVGAACEKMLPFQSFSSTVTMKNVHIFYQALVCVLMTRTGLIKSRSGPGPGFGR